MFYVLLKICVVFEVELNANVIPVKYGRELILACYMHPQQLKESLETYRKRHQEKCKIGMGEGLYSYVD